MNFDEQIKILNLKNSKRHIFICTGSKCPGSTCIDKKQGEALWEYLKLRCKELKDKIGTVQRTKAECLRFCSQGSIAVVYPEGSWYRDVDQDLIDSILLDDEINLKKKRIFQSSGSISES